MAFSEALHALNPYPLGREVAVQEVGGRGRVARPRGLGGRDEEEGRARRQRRCRRGRRVLNREARDGVVARRRVLG